MIRMYISNHCRGCGTALQRAVHLRTQRSDVPLDIVDINDPHADVPANVIGRPMYVWNNRVLFMGSPSEIELLERIGAVYDDPR